MEADPPGPDDPPPYTKYRASRNPFGRKEDDAPAGDERPYTLHGGQTPRRNRSFLRSSGGDGQEHQHAGGQTPRRNWSFRRISKRKLFGRILLAGVAWVALSAVVFLVSALVHRDSVDGGLSGGGFPPFSPTTVLVLGSDRREADSKEPGAKGDSARADSILLMRVGGGHAARLSIPRDTVFDIPGRGPDKVNAAFAYGGAELMAKTVTANLGIPVDHVVEVSFSNFPDLIDAMGGVDYTGGCVVSRINGGARNGGTTLRLKSGTTRIDGKQALALARTRKNACNPRESDLTRARRQQKLFSAMKSRLVSPGAFVRLPFISWAAPKSLRSDMGGPTLLGLFAGVATSGTPPTRVLRPSGGTVLPGGGQALTVSDAEKQRAARRFERE